MKIAIDARLINGQRRGMGNVLYNIILHLKKYLYEEIYLYFDRAVNEDLYTELVKLGYKIIVIKCKNYFCWEQILFPIKIRSDIDVVWFPYNTGTLLIRKKKIVTIHDVMFLKSSKELPFSNNIYQKIGRLYRRIITPIIAKKANEIITISQAAKDDIISKIPKVSSKINVIYNGCNPANKEKVDYESWIDFKHKYNIPEKYFLCLGAMDPRKNTMFTIEVFNSFMKKSDEQEIKLIICGLKNWKQTEYYKRAVELGIENKIIFLDYVSDYTLKTLYINAKIFLFLSYYEGFGLPILESMAYGTPVITTNVTSMPEIAGDAARITSHTNIEIAANDLYRLYVNEDEMDILIAKGYERIKLFAWDVTAKKVAEVIKRLK